MTINYANPIAIDEPGDNAEALKAALRAASGADTDVGTATQAAIDAAVDDLVNAAPGALDTLNELAAALGDDANFAATVTAALGGKEPTITAGTTAQLLQGDKSLIDKAALPISAATQAALDVRAFQVADVATGEAATIPAYAKVCSTQSYSAAAAYGLGGARYKRVTSEPSHDLKFRSADRYLPDATTDETSGGWWEIAEEWITPSMAGAIADGTTDDILALRKWATYFASQPIEQFPGLSPASSAVQIMTLGGKVYGTSGQIDTSDCHGAILCDGGFVALGTWADDLSVIYAADTVMLRLAKISIQCDERTNGVYLYRCQRHAMDQVTVLGHHTQQWGIRVGPTGYSTAGKAVDCFVAGWRGAGTELDFASMTAFGLWIEVNDFTVSGGEYAQNLHPIHIDGGGVIVNGSHIWNSDPDDGLAIPLAIGIWIKAIKMTTITGCYMDSCIIRANSQALSIVGNNWLFSGTDIIETCILLEAEATGQTLADIVIADNNARGGNVNYFVKLGLDSGTFTSVARCLITNNVLRDTADGVITSMGETKGTAGVSFTSGQLDANKCLTVSMAKHWLPVPAESTMMCNVQLFGENYTDTFDFHVLWYDVDTTAQTIKIKFAGTNRSGKLAISYDFSNRVPVIAA